MDYVTWAFASQQRQLEEGDMHRRRHTATGASTEYKEVSGEEETGENERNPGTCGTCKISYPVQSLAPVWTPWSASQEQA